MVELLVVRCAGLDVAKDEVVACVRVPDGGGGRAQEVRTFQTFTSGLEALAAWLAGEGVTQVVMEATGQYWKPVWYVLEEAGFELLLVNARHVKILPGRKTDVCDAALAGGAVGARAAAGQLRAPGPDPRAARPDSQSQAADPGPCLGGPAHPEDLGGCRHQARIGRH
jgi:transposase